jgi:hypothetical protein
MFMFGEAGAKRQISGHRLRRRPGAVRRAVPRLAVLRRDGGGLARPRRVRACPIARRTARVQGAASAPDDLRRRSPPVLPRTAARRRDVQPLLLVPRRPAVFGGLYGFALWATNRDPEMLRILIASSRAGVATTPASTSASTWRWRRGERRADPPRLQRCRRREQLLALWGFVDDHTFLTKAGHVGVVYRLRGIDGEGLTHPQRRALTIASRPRCACSTSTAASTVPLVKRTVAPVRRANMRAAGRQRSHPAARGVPERTTADCTSSRCTWCCCTKRRPRAGEHAAPGSLARAAGSAARPGCRPTEFAALSKRARPRDRHAAPQGQAFEVQLATSACARLHEGDAFRFFRQLVNYDPASSTRRRLTPTTRTSTTSSPTRRSSATAIT